MDIFHSSIALQQEVSSRRAAGQKIGFVPTMGDLHRGHLSLIALARQQCDWLVVSIFVNPLQFSADEDLDRYPIKHEEDTAKCKMANVDALFIPHDFYDADHTTIVRVNKLTSGLCGASRSGHFDGVATVVARLFGIVQPNIAVFGEKDFQQLAVIRRMVRDLAMPITIVPGPLIRDDDGVAFSSRNRYLSSTERIRAQSIYQALLAIKEHVQQSTEIVRTNELRRIARDVLKIDELDYLEFVNPQTLDTLREIKGPVQAMIAAWIGSTRLIDNLYISKES